MAPPSLSLESPVVEHHNQHSPEPLLFNSKIQTSHTETMSKDSKKVALHGLIETHDTLAMQDDVEQH